MTIEPLTSQDHAALLQELALGRRICEFYLDQPAEPVFDTIDRVLDLWFDDPRQAKPSENDIALGLGSLVGDQICKLFTCHWVIVTDVHGCDLGIIDEKTNWQMFPRHWIAKRLDPSNARKKVVSSIVETLVAERATEER